MEKQEIISPSSGDRSDVERNVLEFEAVSEEMREEFRAMIPAGVISSAGCGWSTGFDGYRAVSVFEQSTERLGETDRKLYSVLFEESAADPGHPWAVEATFRVEHHIGGKFTIDRLLSNDAVLEQKKNATSGLNGLDLDYAWGCVRQHENDIVGINPELIRPADADRHFRDPCSGQVAVLRDCTTQGDIESGQRSYRLMVNPGHASLSRASSPLAPPYGLVQQMVTIHSDIPARNADGDCPSNRNPTGSLLPDRCHGGWHSRTQAFRIIHHLNEKQDCSSVVH